MEKPAHLVFEDLTKIGFCSIKDAPIQCASHAAGIDTITLITKNDHIETVNVLINIGYDRSLQYIRDSKENVARIARYFGHRSIDNKEWIFKAIDHSRLSDYPIMTEAGGLSIIIERLTPQTLVEDFEDFTMTRTQNIRNGTVPLSYADECNYNTGRYKRDGDNPDFNYLDESKEPEKASH